MGALIHTGSSSLVSVDPAQSAAIAEKVIAENGNLVKLTAIERKIYYLAMCSHNGFDPWDSPFDYIPTKDKDDNIVALKLYPNIRAANQKAQINKLSIKIVDRKIEITGKKTGKFGEYETGWAECEVLVTDGTREVTDIGIVEIGYKYNRGDAIKKAITQAKRRSVLAFCGLADGGEGGFSSETYDPPIDTLINSGYLESDRSYVTESAVYYGRLLEIMQLSDSTENEMIEAAQKINANPRYLTNDSYMAMRDRLFTLWGFKQNCFKATVHAWNAYQKFKRTLQQDDLSDQDVFDSWRQEIERRLQEVQNGCVELEAEVITAK